ANYTKGSKNSKGKTKFPAGAKVITVKKGDTLGGIAKRHGTTVARLQKLNGIRGTMIRAGQKLRVR
ncbi:MAG: LysM peptidoglycan-binding domain-containing protein, partial [Bacteroidales bacterium]|nr:LysM peptidoglycan-binding domain-containing protein [Bacteroidales bacterium]